MTLYVVATPIGNLEDISIRALKVLFGVAVIVCEDTRRTGMLLQLVKDRFGGLVEHQAAAEKRLISMRDWNESETIVKVLTELEHSDAALVSDAGTPLLSDPGFKLVRAAREAGVTVTPIPGAFAGAAAISVSGLPTDKFMFWGFLGKKWNLTAGMTNLIYESPMRVKKTIEAIYSRYPKAEIRVAAELTKVHEQISEGREYLAGGKEKGEMTLLVYIPE